MKEVIKFLIGKFDYIKTEVLIGVFVSSFDWNYFQRCKLYSKCMETK